MVSRNPFAVPPKRLNPIQRVELGQIHQNAGSPKGILSNLNLPWAENSKHDPTRGRIT